MHAISIIIPTLNEAGNITPLFTRILKSFQGSTVDPEIIIVDDNSTDTTRQEAFAFADKTRLKVIHRKTERGLSTAVMAGVKAATSNTIVVMDADLSHPPESLPALIAPVLNQSHDMVIGSRYTKGGATIGWPTRRRIASRLASLPAQILTSTLDPLAGFFAIKKEFLLRVGENASGFKIGLDAICCNHNIRVKEIPISFTDRNYGTSKMDGKVLGEYVKQIGRIAMTRLSSLTTILPLFIALFIGCANDVLLTMLTTIAKLPISAHLISFFIVSILGYCCIRKRQSNFTYAIVCLLNFFIVSGMFTATSGVLAHIFLIGGTTLSWLMAKYATEHPTLFKENFLALIIFYSITIRILFLGNIELLREEAYYWNYAQNLAPGYLDHPPMVAVLISLGTFLFGNTEFGVRIGAFICWGITATFAYRLTSKIFNTETAVKALALIAVLPAFFATGFLITPDAPLIAAWAGCLYFLYNAFIEKNTSAWYMVGICLGLGLVSKYTIVFLGLAIIVYMLIDKNARKWFLRPQPYFAALIALLIFSPVIYWNFQNDWASFLFQSTRRLHKANSFYTPELLGCILALITPIGLWALIQVARKKNTHFTAQKFCLVMTLVPLAVVFFFSLTKQIKLNWTAPFWLALIPFMVSITWQNAKYSRMWSNTLLTVLIFFGFTFQYNALGLPFVPFHQGVFMTGWQNIASELETRSIRVEQQVGEKPFIVGMDKYQISSGIAFYNAKNNSSIPNSTITGRHLIGKKDLMYSYWNHPKIDDTRDVLLVGRKEKSLEKLYFPHNYRRISPVETIKAEKNGQDAGEVYITRLRKAEGNNAEKTQLSQLAHN